MMAISVVVLIRGMEMGLGSRAVAWLELAWMWMTEARMDTPKHKARTQRMHEKPRKPVIGGLQPALATGPGCCFFEKRDERRVNIVVFVVVLR
jgi:hypothetical protein